MKKTENPFSVGNKNGSCYQAWQLGYDNPTIPNSYALEAGDLHQFFGEGQHARKTDDTVTKMVSYASNHKVGTTIKDKPFTRKGLLRRLLFRVKVLSKLNEGRKFEALYPNDHFDEKDVAFGLLKGNKFIAATDFEGIEKDKPGYISHIAMLQALNLADPDKMETEFERNAKTNLTEQHYIVRGIVKHALKGDILFWEDSKELIDNITFFEGMKKFLRDLKKRNLIKDSAHVYGSGIKVTSLGTVSEIIKAG